MSTSWLTVFPWLIRSSEAHRDELALQAVPGRQVVQIHPPTFTLTDQDEQPFSLQSWRGRVIVVTFGYTTCPDVCPLLAAHLAVIQQEIPAVDRSRTGLLFITTDPSHDRPAVLQAYGTRLGADFSTWKFLTGSIEDLTPVWRAFAVAVKTLGPGQVDHTALTTIVDREGIRRVNYYGTRWHPQAVMRDMAAWAHD
jgi:protein SCO1/2